MKIQEDFHNLEHMQGMWYASTIWTNTMPTEVHFTK